VGFCGTLRDNTYKKIRLLKHCLSITPEGDVKMSVSHFLQNYNCNFSKNMGHPFLRILTLFWDLLGNSGIFWDIERQGL